MSALFLIAIAFGVVVLLAAFLQQQNRSSHPESAYESRGTLFSPAERSFLGVLQQAVGEEYVVFGKVRLGDIVQPAKGLDISRRLSALNKVNLKHLDFLVCRADDLALIAAVELDDKSHQRKDRNQRDAFVDQVLASAGIPLLRFPAQKGYALAEVKGNLDAILHPGIAEETATVSVDQVPAAAATEVAVELQEKLELVSNIRSAGPVVCPVCQSEMVQRQARKGPHAGDWFWACSTFPKCRKVVQFS